jgi:hypothetical protein
LFRKIALDSADEGKEARAKYPASLLPSLRLPILRRGHTTHPTRIFMSDNRKEPPPSDEAEGNGGGDRDKLPKGVRMIADAGMGIETLQTVGNSNSMVLEVGVRETVTPDDGVPLSAHGTASLIANAAVPPKKSRRSTTHTTQRLVIRNRQQVVAYSTLIISALQEAMDYDPARHDNRPRPALWIEDADYLQDIRDLIAELKRLNTLLETRRPQGEPHRAAIDLKKHLNKFLDNYIPLMAKGTACLTVAAMAGLLHHIGVGDEFILGVFATAKLAHR